MNDDAELLRRHVDDRSEAAFAELVRRHLTLVYFAALRRTGGDRHLAEDVAQGVFTALARDAAALVQHPTLTGWLYTTTRRVAAKAVRTEQRRQAREQEAHLMSELANGPEVAADWERLRPVIDAALDELSDRDREAVLWRCWEGRAYADIGAALRVTEDAARMRVDRALERLRDVLAKRGVTSTGAALAAARRAGRSAGGGWRTGREAPMSYEHN
ncbi:MAG: sigma-70 family RNA polymerase sigma factor [Verrucomicrobia bacterium]|nr:sigma-70 family RNA polymerase sigma factor [Verrucomicrobiota bacterium]